MIDLMTPRYEVVADYPKSEYPKGMIIDLSQHPRFVSGNVMGSLWNWEAFFEEYPMLFKRLAWHEKRDIKDMPEYVKYDGAVWRVSWEEHLGLQPYTQDSETDRFLSVDWYFNRNDFTPATATEYDN